MPSRGTLIRIRSNDVISYESEDEYEQRRAAVRDNRLRGSTVRGANLT